MAANDVRGFPDAYVPAGFHTLETTRDMVQGSSRLLWHIQGADLRIQEFNNIPAFGTTGARTSELEVYVAGTGPTNTWTSDPVRNDVLMAASPSRHGLGINGSAYVVGGRRALESEHTALVDPVQYRGNKPTPSVMWSGGGWR